MRVAPALAMPLLGLVLASSAGPDAAGHPAFVPRVSTARTVLSLGGHRFLVTKTARTFPLVLDPDLEGMGHSQRPSSETVALAQIADPATESDRLWNALARERIGPMLREAYEGATATGTASPARQTTVEVGIEPVAVAPGMIAAQVHRYVFPHDLARGWGSFRALIWWERDRRVLTADDLFDPATGWWQALVPAMLEAAYEEPVPEGVKGYEALDRRQSPMIGEKGLCLKFDEEDVGAFVLAQPIFLPWTVVRPYLRKDLPFDPAKLEERQAGWEGCDSWRFPA